MNACICIQSNITLRKYIPQWSVFKKFLNVFDINCGVTSLCHTGSATNISNSLLFYYPDINHPSLKFIFKKFKNMLIVLLLHASKNIYSSPDVVKGLDILQIRLDIVIRFCSSKWSKHWLSEILILLPQSTVEILQMNRKLGVQLLHNL